ncbi:predicted protein [Nematostella vectensis]|uniref:DEP domain-containing protein n=1 Tax=Nematostella vectensis TaxID=45351 RepID=A7S344_NEMVE|nr:predicted protein [Nematostella vectensis]|eukprot:XP_001633962.1 predicted protein [Nematostella vectensis]
MSLEAVFSICFGTLLNLKYWKSRFLLLPLSRRKGNNAGPDGQDGKSDNITDESARIEGLLKFIEILNGVKRTNARRRPFSPKKSLGNLGKDPRARAQTLPDSESAPKEGAGGGPLTGKTIALSSSLGPVDSGGESRRHSSVDGLSEPSSPGVDEPAVTTEGDVLSVKSPLEAIVDAMLDPKGGMTFLPSLKGLDSKCFLAIEAVWWLMHHVDGVADRNGAVALAQRMLEARVILHASKSTRQNFFYGFAIFQFANEKLRSEVEEKPGRYAHYHRTLMEQQLKDFQGDWVEIAFTQYAPPSVIPAFLAPDSALEMIPLTSPTLRSLASVRRGRAKSASQQAMLMGECACAYKLVNLDCDPQHKSDRPEWCTLRYHGNYNPAHAFEMEVHWIEATGSIVHDMVQSWARKATSCGFVLVPAPVSPFPDPSSGNIDPLRLPIFIPLNLSGCIVDERDSLFKDLALQKIFHSFHLLSLGRFGFLKDSPYGPLFNTFTFVATPVQCRADDFVHVSGTAFVRIHDQDEDVRLDLYGPVSSGLLGERGSGFYWETNYMLSKRWRSASTGDLESARKLQAEFVEFCSDTKGVLRAFWESCKDEVRKAAEEKLRSERLKVEEISLTSESEETAGSFTDTDTEGTGAE